MKKLIGIAALILAFTPFAQAENNMGEMPGHADARNDRQVESHDRGAIQRSDHVDARHVRHAKPHHLAKRHHMVRHDHAM